jgi:HPt (histidine-containing phosphotransfer) domain-containing protein
VTPARPDPLVNSARLHDLGDQYGDLMTELVEIFATTTPAVLVNLSAAAARDDDVAIRAAAHNLKGACLNVGATFMADLCRTLETDSSVADVEIDRLTDAFEPTLADLRSPVPR